MNSRRSGSYGASVWLANKVAKYRRNLAIDSPPVAERPAHLPGCDTSRDNDEPVSNGKQTTSPGRVQRRVRPLGLQARAIPLVAPTSPTPDAGRRARTPAARRK